MINEKNKIDKELFDSLGFYWNRLMIPENVPIHNINRVCFRLQKMLAQYIWDASILDKITFTYPQVQTIIDGITVGGHKISDQNHVINLASSTKELISLVKTNEFKLNKKTFTYINSIVTRKYSFEWSEFSNKEKSLNNGNMNFMDGYITKIPLNVELNSIFFDGINKLEMILNPLERGIIFFLFSMIQKFVINGNKSTSIIMMNGVLMSNGIDAISIPASHIKEFNEKMIDFYINRNATVMIDFLIKCHPDFEFIKK